MSNVSDDHKAANPALTVPCIKVAFGPAVTVADYEGRWRETPVEELTSEWAYRGARVIDPVAYQAQMLHLLGLD